MTLPLAFIHGNILVGQGDARAAIYKAAMTSFPFLAEQDKVALGTRLADFAATAEADFSVYRLARAYPAASYVDQAMHMHDERVAEHGAWETYLAGHQQHLEGMQAFGSETYIVVSLRPERQSIVRTPSDLVPAVRQALGSVTGMVQPITRSALEALQAAEETARRHIEGHLNVRPATTEEIQWLLRRPACRGIAEPDLDQHWKPPALSLEGGSYEPVARDLIRFYNNAITEQSRSLVVESNEGTTHQTCLVLGAMPDESHFPGDAELLFDPLERVDFPVDAVCHARWISNRDMLKTIHKRVRDADIAKHDQGEGAVSWEADENRVLSREAEAEYRSSARPPGLEITISLALGARDRETLKKRVDRLRHVYGTIKLEQPFGLQAQLFNDHLVRCDGGTVADYADPFTVQAFGALMPLGTHQAGSDRGVYIGHTTSAGTRPVRFDITEASRTGRPPSILLAGTLGSGKTIAAELLALQAAHRGSLVVDVDPKPDHHLEDLPELDGRVHVIELSGNEAYRGLLDPLVVAPEAIREDLAISYFMELLRGAPPDWEAHIIEAVKVELQSLRPCSIGVIGHLRNSNETEAQAVGHRLETWADSGLGRLGFGAGATVETEVRMPVTTIKARGLTLPDPTVSRADYDRMERLSVATLSLVAAYAMRLVSGDRSVHKAILFDEAWALLGSQAGRRLIDRLNRMGRSENATLILATQQLADVGDIEALVGTRFIFGQETTHSAEQALRLLGLDPNDRAMVERLRGFRRGRCLMKDIDDRIAELQWDVVDPRLLGVLDTSPRRQEVAA